MVSREEFIKLVGRLSEQVVDSPDSFTPTQRNEEWTKINFILPLLEALGWDRFKDIGYEDSSQEVEGWLDFMLLSEPRIGIEAKALDINPPIDHNHPQIEKGLKQTRERDASYFIWTNGDCWQFFPLSMPDAPIYEIRLSQVQGDNEQIQQISSEFHIIEKDTFTANPMQFEEAIREKWKIAALPGAFDKLVNERGQDLIQLIKQDLPSNLGIKDKEILSFLKALKPPGESGVRVKSRMKHTKEPLSFPEDWQKLIDSFEPEYDRPRKRFLEGYYRKLAKYLIGEKYSPWSKSTTWRHVSAPNDTSERKKLGNVISLFRKWHFIEDADKADMYQRVDESIPYLQKLIEKTVNSY